MAEKKKHWLSGAWAWIFPKGAKNYRDVMTHIEKLLATSYKFIIDHKPDWIYSYYGKDRNVRKIMYELNGTVQQAVETVAVKVKKKYSTLFDGWRRQDYKDLYENIELKNVDVSTEAGVKALEELGYSEGVISYLKEMQELHKSMFDRLSRFYPELEYDPTSYGFNVDKGGPDYIPSSEYDWNTSFSKSGLKENTLNLTDRIKAYVRGAARLIAIHELMEKADTATDTKGNPLMRAFSSPEAAVEAGFNPVSDGVFDIIDQLKKQDGYVVVIDGKKASSKGSVSVFASKEEAQAAIDSMSSALEGKEVSIEEHKKSTQKQIYAYSVYETVMVHNPNTDKFESKKNQIAQFSSKDAAQEYIDNHDDEFKMEPLFAEAETAVAARKYFHPELASMLNIILSKDIIKSNTVLSKVVSVKNFMTTIEFALSMFHAMTIGQETVSTHVAIEWKKGRIAGVPKLHRLREIMRLSTIKEAFHEATDIAMLMEEVLAETDISTNPALQKKMESLLGVSEVDAMEMLQMFFTVGGITGMDTSLRSGVHEVGHSRYATKDKELKIIDGKLEVVRPSTGKPIIGQAVDVSSAMKKSLVDAFNSELEKNPDHPLKAIFKASSYGVLNLTSDWLMEDLIPKVKIGMWSKEYALLLEENKADIDSGLVTKTELAERGMRFVEDKFGEANWLNMWMHNTTKSALQFVFRSFTWFTGSFAALGKAGIDVSRLGWYTIKGDKYTLNEHGIWGFTALFTHMMTVGVATAIYQAASLGVEEVPEDEETPFLTKILFPRNDAIDPESRITIPSYVTEAYKIASHIGILNTEAEYTKLISGRVNTLITNAAGLYKNEDWRGVQVVNPDDNIVSQGLDALLHMFPVSFSIGSAYKTYESKGMTPQMAVAFLGITGAPAAAKRSEATNKAFHIRRKEYKGKVITEEEFFEKQEMKRAFYAYSQGDSSKINKLRREGKLSQRQFNNGIKRLAVIDGRMNPKYEDPLSRALSGLTLKGALETWEYMSANEKLDHKHLIVKKYRNMMARKDRAKVFKDAAKQQMKDSGLL
jgi:hypothetical protein